MNGGDSLFPDGESDPEEAELQRLAATRAAIDPGRQESRRDILTSAALEVLATQGDRTTASLREALAHIFQTEAVTIPELDEALREARVARLVQIVTDLEGKEKWQVTPAARQESREDREWALSVMERFSAQVRRALEDIGADLTTKQIEKAPQEFYRALAAGCCVAPGSAPVGVEYLRPVEFNVAAVGACLAGVEPKSLRSALQSLVPAACDPDDDFAQEVVHMLVVSNILVGFLSKRDLGPVPALEEVRLLLDTQLLVDLVDGNSASQQVVENLIGLSVNLGAQVMVADHSIREWDRLWAGAENEHPESFDEYTAPRYASRLAGNPFVAQYLAEKVDNPSQTWMRFKSKRMNISAVLGKLGVTVRESGNNRVEDRVLVEAMREEMDRIVRASHGRRTRASVEADAESAAMVARWRKKYPATPCSSFFVGADSLTGKAYKVVVSDDAVPLTVRPGAWLMFVAYMTSDGRDTTDMAGIVGSALVRDSFLAVATSYTLEEVMKLSTVLAEDDGLSLEDSREAVQLDLLELLDDRASLDAEQRASAAAAEVMRRRSARRDARAKRAEERALRQAHEGGIKVDEAEARAATAAQLASETQSALTKTERKLNETQDQARRLRRILVSGGLFVSLAGIAVGAILSGALPHWWAIVAALGALYFVARAIQFCVDLETKFMQVLTSATGEAVWMIAGVILGKH